MQLVDMWRTEDGLHGMVPLDWVSLFTSLGWTTENPANVKPPLGE